MVRAAHNIRLQAGAALMAVLLAILACGAALAEPRFPTLTGRIVDEAAL